MNTVTKIAQAITSGINAEVAQQRQVAIERITDGDVAREWVNANITNMEALVQGEFTVEYKSERGATEYKQQDLNDALWAVILQLVLESGDTNYHNMELAFGAWLQTTTLKNVSVGDWSVKFINEMKRIGLLTSDLHERNFVGNDGKMHLVKVFILTDDCQQQLTKCRGKLVTNSSMVCIPLHNEPLDWLSSTDGVGDGANLRLAPTEVDSWEVLLGVNKLQSVQYKVNPLMVNMAYILMDNDIGTAEEQMRYKAVQLLPNTPIYFPITMDGRGRMYARGGISTYQGTDFDKASYMFAVARPLGKHGFSAIQIQVANCLGFDKLSMIDRLSATRDCIDSGLLDLDYPDDIKSVYKGASKYQAWVAVQELKAVIAWTELGNDPADFQSCLICHRDGTANGLQHMSAITKNMETARTVNCTKATPLDLPYDIYGVISTEAMTLVPVGSLEYSAIHEFNRDLAKYPVMITGYGAGRETVTATVVKYLASTQYKAVAVKVALAILQAIENKATAVSVFTKAIKARMTLAVEQGHETFTWCTADGFVCDIKYEALECNRIRAGYGEGSHSALKRVHAPLDEVKTVGAMPPNFIHSIDATHVRMVAIACDWELSTVHDSIGSHPCNYFETGQIIRQQFVDLHNYDAIGNLCASMSQRKPLFMGTYDYHEASDAIYMFS